MVGRLKRPCSEYINFNQDSDGFVQFQFFFCHVEGDSDLV